jgi:hypothetical protein
VYMKLIFTLNDRFTQIKDAKNLGHISFVLVPYTCLLLFFIQLNIYLRFCECVHMLIDERTSLARKCNQCPWVRLGGHCGELSVSSSSSVFFSAMA